MIATAIFMIALWGVIDGTIWLVRHERARRRANRFQWPPMKTIEVSDEIPF